MKQRTHTVYKGKRIISVPSLETHIPRSDRYVGLASGGDIFAAGAPGSTEHPMARGNMFLSDSHISNPIQNHVFSKVPP